MLFSAYKTKIWYKCFLNNIVLKMTSIQNNVHSICCVQIPRISRWRHARLPPRVIREDRLAMFLHITLTTVQSVWYIGKKKFNTLSLMDMISFFCILILVVTNYNWCKIHSQLKVHTLKALPVHWVVRNLSTKKVCFVLVCFSVIGWMI